MKSLLIIPEIEQLDEYVRLAEENDLGFEYNDFYVPAILDDEKELNRRINLYRSVNRERKNDTLHGVFLDICVNSSDSMIFRASDTRIRQSLDIAQALSVKKVVFHTNYIANFNSSSYRELWVSENEKYWRRILTDYPELEICIENMFDENPELICRLAERMQDETRFGICFDVAHAYLSTAKLDEWFKAVKPYVKHVHVNDNDGASDLHQALGMGTLPFNEFDRFMNSFDGEDIPSMLIEVKGLEKIESSLNYLKENNLYPFEK